VLSLTAFLLLFGVKWFTTYRTLGISASVRFVKQALGIGWVSKYVQFSLLCSHLGFSSSALFIRHLRSMPRRTPHMRRWHILSLHVTIGSGSPWKRFGTQTHVTLLWRQQRNSRDKGVRTRRSVVVSTAPLLEAPLVVAISFGEDAVSVASRKGFVEVGRGLV
jgi:hypothetical protein